MISLTDSQLAQVMELAAPIPVEQRDAFLRLLAGELMLGPASCTGCASRCGAASCLGPRL
jgi:hypothetical protein